MVRPRTVGKKTTIGISQDLVGWLEYAGREYAGGMTEYLMTIAEADRAKTLAEGGEIVERYRAYLVATGRTAELEALETAEA